MSTDLSKREEQTLDYMKEILKTEFPEADLRNDGEFMEMFGLPHVKLFEPLLTYIDRLKLMQSLENAAFMTTEEMDEVAVAHYTAREMGKRSLGSVTLILDDVPSSGMLVIPVGIEVTSKKDLRYRSIETLTLTESTLASYYDSSSFMYRIPVLFQAVSPGSEYDAKIGEISELIKGSIPNLSEVVNEVDFVGGTNSETNEELAARIKLESFAPNLGIERGYTRYINSFENVRESKIVGFGHPLMKRDIIGEVSVPGIKFNDNVRDLHWGTKVDVYVRGESPDVQTDYLIAEKDEQGELFVLLKKVPVLDVVNVRLYSLDASLDDPDIDQSTLNVTNYALVKEEDFETEGTLDEVARLYINDSRVVEGGYVEVVYRFNGLISNIHDTMYTGDGRPPTADVKVKESNKKFVYGSLIVGMNNTLGLRDTDRSIIRQRLSSWIDDLAMGSELQFSDLLEPLTALDAQTPTRLVDYVHLPFQFFVTENQSRYIFFCMNETKRKMIASFGANNEFLHGIFEKYKDVVTTYDFFDILHSLTSESGFEDNIKNIQFQSGVQGAMASTFTNLRHMTLMSQASKRLSPAIKNIGEHEYFDFGETYVYEAKTYTQNDWEKMIQLFWNIAKQGEETDSVTEMYHLVVYILVMMYMVTSDSESLTTTKIIEFTRKLVVSTPIEFELNI